MGLSGRRLEKDLDLDEVKEIIFEEFGRVIRISKRLHCSDKAVYDLLDMYPELQEARMKAANRRRDQAVEISEDLVERLIRLEDDDIELAAKQAQFVLKNSDMSPYRDAKKDNTEGVNPATLARMAQEDEKRAPK